MMKMKIIDVKATVAPYEWKRWALKGLSKQKHGSFLPEMVPRLPMGCVWYYSIDQKLR